MASSEETKLDLAELQKLLNQATRPRVRDSLVREIDQLQREVQKLESKTTTKSNPAGQVNGAQTLAHHQGYTEKITNYAWDQSDKFMKLYLSLNNLSSLKDEDIEPTYSEKSVTVRVKFPDKTSELHIASLCEPIVPSGCHCKKKPDYVLVMLKKSEVGKTWPTVTEREKKSKEKDKPKFDENEDPSAGITKLLKNMYDDGDDEMKRSISKAFYESQMKQAKGESTMDV